MAFLHMAFERQKDRDYSLIEIHSQTLETDERALTNRVGLGHVCPPTLYLRHATIEAYRANLSATLERHTPVYHDYLHTIYI